MRDALYPPWCGMFGTMSDDDMDFVDAMHTIGLAIAAHSEHTSIEAETAFYRLAGHLCKDVARKAAESDGAIIRKTISEWAPLHYIRE